MSQWNSYSDELKSHIKYYDPEVDSIGRSLLFSMHFEIHKYYKELRISVFFFYCRQLSFHLQNTISGPLGPVIAI